MSKCSSDKRKKRAPVIPKYSCDCCLRALTAPFIARCFEPNGDSYVLKNTFPDEAARVVVYLHANCRAAAGDAGPIIAASPNERRWDVAVVAGRKSYTSRDLRLLADGRRFLLVLPGRRRS